MQPVLLVTLLAGGLGMCAPALLSRSPWHALAGRATSLCAGTLLATSFLYALPSAFESSADRRALCATLLGGLLAFFLAEKCVIMLGAAHSARRVRTGRAPWAAVLAVLAIPVTAAIAAAAGIAALRTREAGMLLVAYVLVLASSACIYVALSAMVPKMQRAPAASETLPQLLLVGAGVALVSWLCNQVRAL